MVSYTLYPETTADVMAAEVLRALQWSLGNAAAFGGDPARLAVVGHSAGAHLAALALMLLARLREREAEGPAAAAATMAAAAVAAHTSGAGAAGGTSGGGGAGVWQPGPVRPLARPQLFVGMSGVYNVARHHEYEMHR